MDLSSVEETIEHTPLMVINSELQVMQLTRLNAILRQIIKVI